MSDDGILQPVFLGSSGLGSSGLGSGVSVGLAL
jgi:hypothetical protein